MMSGLFRLPGIFPWYNLGGIRCPYPNVIAELMEMKKTDGFRGM